MYFLFYLIFRLFEFFIPVFSRGFIRKLLGIQSLIFFYLMPFRKKVALCNLKLAFPEKSEEEILKIIKECYYNVLIVISEFFTLRRYKKSDFEKIICLTNPELIREKLSYGRGLILLSAHYGNWELTAYGVSLLCETPFNVVVKKQTNHRIDREINLIRSSGGNKMIEMTEVRHMLKCLTQGEILAMLGDQSSPEGNVKVKFFGYDVPFYEGPARLAMKNKTPILFGLSEPCDDLTYKVTLKEINLFTEGSTEENIRHIIQQYAEMLEFHIRKNPPQWLWFHRRFKSLIQY
ncbi:MAG: lysophospholipid acyltransferase family protein [Ignavibacteria bacterium]|nr:lysophospholipid acyltransferase family protein [Ignavibacteria bacterium]